MMHLEVTKGVCGLKAKFWVWEVASRIKWHLGGDRARGGARAGGKLRSAESQTPQVENFFFFFAGSHTLYLTK